MPSLSEQQVRTLVSRIRNGDQAAGRILVAAYSGRLYALASKRLAPMGCRRRLSAEDVVQSVFKSILRTVSVRPQALQFEDDDDLFGWLATVTCRKCYRILRRDRYFVEPDEGFDERHIDLLCSREPDIIEQSILDETISRLLETLDSDEKEIARRLLLGHNMAQVASDLGRATYAVKLVRDRLRRELDRMNKSEIRLLGHVEVPVPQSTEAP